MKLPGARAATNLDSAGEPAGRSLLYVCFFLSGAASLIYEVVWMRQLTLMLGSTTPAVSTVLATFMLGLALGAWMFGPVADRTRDPLRLYAHLEAGIGLYALLLPFLTELTRSSYVVAAQALAGHAAAIATLRLLSAVVLLVVPTILMGATLPVLVRFLGRSRAQSRQLGLIYGTNVAGAVVGCTTAGFALIRYFGVTGASTFAAVLNLGVAAVVLLLAGVRQRTKTTDWAPEPAPPQDGPAPRTERSLLWATVFVSGFVTMGCEVLWTRMLVFSFSSTVHAFTIILATFLTGLTLGSWVYAWLIASKRESLPMLAAAQITAGLTAVALVPWAARAADFIAALSQRTGYSGGSFVAGAALSSAAVMLLPTIVMGIVFPMGTRMLASDSRRVGSGVGGAYLANTVGGALGALGVPFLLLPLLNLQWSMIVLSLLQISLGWLLLRRSALSATRRLLALGGSAALFGVCVWFVTEGLHGPSPFDSPSRFRPLPFEVVAHSDGATASVSVVRYAGGHQALRIDGFEAAAEDSDVYSYMRLMTHLPLLLHPSPKRLLVISFGTGSTAGSGLLHPGVKIDAVDINPAVFGFGSYFANVNGGVLTNPRARAIVDDGRNYLLVTREKYDVITSEPMPPTFAGIVNLYSREYYQLAREALNPGGFVVQWLPFSLVDRPQALAILRTVSSVFPDTTTLWIQGRSGIIIARRDQPITIDPAGLRRRLNAPALREGLRRIGIEDTEDITSFYALGPENVARLTASAGVITDEHPIIEHHPVRHVFYEVRTFYREDELAVLNLVHGLRLGERLPLRDASPDDALSLQERLEVAAHSDLGEIWQEEQNFDRANAILTEGYRGIQGADARARLLYRMAVLALKRGRKAEAQRLVEESLSLAPDLKVALALREQLLTS